MFQMQTERDAMLTSWHVPLPNLLIRLVPKGPECIFHYGLFSLKAAGGLSANCPELKGIHLFKNFHKLGKLSVSNMYKLHVQVRAKQHAY